MIRIMLSDNWSFAGSWLSCSGSKHRSDTALVFHAGHGLHTLAPIILRPLTLRLKTKTRPAQLVQSPRWNQFFRKAPVACVILIVDACRDNEVIKQLSFLL